MARDALHDTGFGGATAGTSTLGRSLDGHWLESRASVDQVQSGRSLLGGSPPGESPESSRGKLLVGHRGMWPEWRSSNCPKNPDPQTHRVLRARTPAMEGPTPAMESPRILRVCHISTQNGLKLSQMKRQTGSETT